MSPVLNNIQTSGKILNNRFSAGQKEIRVVLILRHGYKPEKCHANRNCAN
jgi:hypothetical protein